MNEQESNKSPSPPGTTTKIYDLVHLNGQMYMVSHSPGDGNWYLNGRQLYQSKSTGLGGLYDDQFLPTKMLASTDPSLNLPLLPQIEPFDLGTDITKLNTPPRYDNHKGGYLYSEGDILYLFDQAAKAKKYTEEDMFKSFIAGRKFQTGGKSSKDPKRDEPDFDVWIKSLTPLPKQVEVEMESLYAPETVTTIGDDPIWRLKVINNIVQIKRWIYD